MTAYIATKFQNVNDFDVIKTMLESKGYEIIVDWTKHKSVKPFSENSEICKDQSYDDIIGIEDCDLFLLYFDD